MQLLTDFLENYCLQLEQSAISDCSIFASLREQFGNQVGIFQNILKGKGFRIFFLGGIGGKCVFWGEFHPWILYGNVAI